MRRTARKLRDPEQRWPSVPGDLWTSLGDAALRIAINMITKRQFILVVQRRGAVEVIQTKGAP